MQCSQGSWNKKEFKTQQKMLVSYIPWFVQISSFLPLALLPFTLSPTTVLLLLSWYLHLLLFTLFLILQWPPVHLNQSLISIVSWQLGRTELLVRSLTKKVRQQLLAVHFHLITWYPLLAGGRRGPSRKAAQMALSEKGKQQDICWIPNLKLMINSVGWCSSYW